MSNEHYQKDEALKTKKPSYKGTKQRVMKTRVKIDMIESKKMIMMKKIKAKI